MKPVSNLQHNDEADMRPVRNTADDERVPTAANRQGSLRLIDSAKSVYYWQTDSRNEALARAIARTG